MRIVQAVDIVKAGRFPRTAVWRRAVSEVEAAIASVDWAPDSGSFSLNPEPGVDRRGRPDRHPNGVMPIKLPLVRHLTGCGWEAESLPATLRWREPVEPDAGAS